MRTRLHAFLCLVLAIGLSCGPEADIGSDDIAEKVSHVAPAPGDLAVGSISVTQISGDGDGVLDPGEAAQILITLNNTGAGTASAVSATLSSSSGDVSIVRGTSAYPDIASGGSGTNVQAFLVRIASGASCGASLPLRLNVSYTGGSTLLSPPNLTLDASGDVIITSTHEPIRIPAVGTIGTVEATIAVSGLSGALTNVNVRINDLVHTWDGDLDIELIGPDGTSVELTTDNGGSGDNYVNTIFDDTAATSITVGITPFTGTYRPEGSLSAFNGKDPNGTWTLRITDDASGDFGTLTSWGLVLTTPTTCTTCAPLSISPTSLVDGRVASAYSQTFSASGGSSPYSFSVGGSLPAGLSVTSDVLSGTPTARTEGAFRINVADDEGCIDYRDYELYVSANVVLAPTSLSSATGSHSYEQQISASGGTGPYAFTLSAGSLPNGLSLSSTGLLSGTPSEAGTFNFSITATDQNGDSGARSYSLTVQTTIGLAPATLPMMTANSSSPYTVTLSGSGGLGPYTFAVTEGTLPAGLVLHPSGVLSGIPAVAGSFQVTVRATDANGFTGTRTYILSVSAVTIVLEPATLPGYVAGSGYSATFSASGGTAPYSFAVSEGTLPAGLSLVDGVLSGTPTEAGSFPIEVTASDSRGFAGSQRYTLVGNGPLIVLSPTELADIVALTEVAVNFGADGGQGPYSFAVTSGALPEGLALSPGGVLSGQATEAGDFTFTVTAMDANGFTGSVELGLHVSAPGVSMGPATLPDFVGGVAYTVTLTVQGSTAQYTFSLRAGSLPTGLSLSSEGVLSGTTSAVGDFALTVKAEDQYGFTVERVFTLHGRAPSFTVSPETLSALTGGVAFSQALTATGGQEPYSFSVDGSTLPPGLTLSGAGVLAGTPTTVGEYSFAVTVRDGNNFESVKSYTVTVQAPGVTISPATLSSGREGQSYSVTLEASGGVGPYSFAVESGTLPTGLTLSTSGVLSGTPGSATVATFTVKATDAHGFSGQRAYTLSIVGQSVLQIAPEQLSEAKVAQGYEATLTASGGAGAYVFTISSGTLPAGLELTAEGKLSGTPSEEGQYTFTVQVTDSVNNEGTREYTLQVVSGAGGEDSGVRPDAGAQSDTGVSGETSDDGGCSCSTSPRSAGSVGWLPLGLLLLLGWCWRRRR